MPDRYGPRGVFAIMIPQQNANMQPEYEMMRPRGISNQIFRFSLAQHDKAPDAMVAAISAAAGFEVPYHTGLQVQTPQDIIRVGPKEAIEAFRKLDHDDVDTFLHVGGALGIVDHLDAMEAELGRPIVSSNAATYWYALRKHGITDPMPGFGQLLMRTEIPD